jgi:tyrosine-protein kinase Etk/Wzc
MPQRPFQSAEPMITKREILGVLFLRKWTVLSMFLMVVGVAAVLVLYLLSPRYEASTTLTIQPFNFANPWVDGVLQTDVDKSLIFHTQKDVIQSSLIAGRVVDRLGLAQRRKVGQLELVANRFRAQRSVLGAQLGVSAWTRPVDARASAIEALGDGLELTTRPDSTAIRISCQAFDPVEAAEICNAIVDEYSRYYYGQIQERSTGMLAYVEERLQAARQRLKDSEMALLAFRQHDTLVLEGAVEPAAAGSRSRPALPPAHRVVGVTDSPHLQNEMKSYVLAMEDELRKLLTEYPDAHPAVRELRRRVAVYTSTMSEIPARDVELTRLRRELDVNQAAFIDLRKSLDRMNLMASGSADNVRLINVVDAAMPKDRVVAPRPRIAMGLAAVFGLLFGIVAAFALEYLDHRVRSVRDVEQLLGLRLIASIEELKR